MRPKCTSVIRSRRSAAAVPEFSPVGAEPSRACEAGLAVNARGQKMLEVDAATGTLTIPIWAAGAVSAVFLVLVVLAIGRAGPATTTTVLFRMSIFAAAIFAGWLYLLHTERQEQAAERRSFEERSAALLARAVTPGSALSCLDELVGETVETACEKAVFASPEAVSAAVTYVTAKLALLVDGNEHLRRVDPTFASELTPLLTSLESDRFGIVAHVLDRRYGCTAENCDALTWFSDHGHVLANLRDHTFDGQVTKFAAMWSGPQRAAADGAASAAPMVALPNPGPLPGVVSPRYDFPSSQSIPPVNIMAPESPRVGAPNGQNGQSAAPSGDGNPRPAANVLPRRPPQGRAPAASGPRQPGPHPAAPVAVREAPTDGAVTPPSTAPPQ